MIKIVILVEGQTEAGFVKTVLAPYLAQYHIHCFAELIVTKGSSAGGLVSWGQAKNNLNRLFLSERTAYISTMLDFYRFPSDIPNYPLANSGTALQRALAIEAAMQECFVYAKARFIPFVTLHEFEALLFSNPAVIAAHAGSASQQAPLTNILSLEGNPEDINHGADTHPAARLKALGNYGKVRDGVTLAEKIGIQTMLEKCPHFAAWVQQLCVLGKKGN